MADFVAYLANCPIHGELNSKGMGVIPLYLGKPQEAYLIQLPQKNSFNKLAGYNIHTTNLEIPVAEDLSKEFLVSVAENISWLLSFATMSPVTPFHYCFNDQEWGYSVGTTLNFFRPSIEVEDGRKVRTFVENSWAGFRSTKYRRKLNRIIDYLVISEKESHIEVKALLCITIIESLKATNIPLREECTFKERVKYMFSDIGMNCEVDWLVNLRNDLVHEGLANMELEDLIVKHEQLHDIIREYLLRLFGYRGEFLLYSKASREAGFI